MGDVKTYIGAELRRIYQSVVRKPMPWRMIDALVTLEEQDEKADQKPAAHDGAKVPGKDVEPH